MRYPVALGTGSDSAAFGIVVPDLPGCFSAGDTIDQAMGNVEEAIDLWIEAALDAGQEIPAPSTLDAIQARPEFAGWAFGVVTIDPAALDDRIERVNITIPRRVLYRLDQRAKAAGETRSGYIARLALG
jgi:predicted RNase H-like HicB family nuclease